MSFGNESFNFNDAKLRCPLYVFRSESQNGISICQCEINRFELTERDGSWGTTGQAIIGMKTPSGLSHRGAVGSRSRYCDGLRSMHRNSEETGLPPSLPPSLERGCMHMAWMVCGARELTARRDGWVVLVLWRPADPIIKLTALTRRSPFYDLCQLLRTFQPFQPCGYSKAVLQFQLLPRSRNKLVQQSNYPTVPVA